MNNIEFISAGAGSGKTYKLTTTLAEALESGAARPQAILATTFTVKAATELRERARSRLLDKGRIDLATAIGQARLGTVNSVCGQMLKRFCFELGLSPDQTVLSDGQTKRLLAASFPVSGSTSAPFSALWKPKSDRCARRRRLIRPSTENALLAGFMLIYSMPLLRGSFYTLEGRPTAYPPLAG